MAAWYGKDYVRLQQEIRGLSVEDVESYNIRYVSNKVKTLPPEIGRLANLKRLYVHGAPSLECLPQEIGKLTKLEELLVYYCPINQLPTTIQKLQNLHTLELVGLKFDKTTDWGFLKSIKNLKRLTIRLSIPKSNITLPSALFEVKSLVYLDLSSNKLVDIPKALAQLQNLETLCVSSNNFSVFPEFITTLPKLTTLKINVNSWGDIPKELAQLPKDLIIEGNKNEKKSQNVLTIIEIFQKGKQLGFTKVFRSLLLKILKKGKAELEKLPEKSLFELLNCQVGYFEKAALTEITARRAAQELLIKYPIDKNSNVLVLGKVVAKRELTQHIRQYEAHIRRKFSPKITHIIIGKQAGEDYKLLNEPKVVGLTEKMLIDYFNRIEKPYLIHNTDNTNLVQNIESIRALLYNKNPENVELAFGLLSGGGFPKELLIDMLLVYKGSYKPKHKTKAKNYIEQYGSTELLAGIKRRFLFWGYIRPATLAKTINFYGAFEDIDKIKMIELLYRQGQRRVICAVMEHYPSEKKVDFIRDCIVEGVLNWSNTGLKILPKELALLKDEIFELNLNGCYFAGDFPKVVLKLENLHTLHIRNKWWDKEAFPKEVLKMPKLKDIHVSRKKTGLPSTAELNEHKCKVHIS